MGEPDDIDDIDEEVMEVIESEDEDEAADEDVDEDAEVEEARAPSPQGEWLAPDGHVSPCGWRGPWASSDEDSFTSSSTPPQTSPAMSEEEVKDPLPPLPPAVSSATTKTSSAPLDVDVHR